MIQPSLNNINFHVEEREMSLGTALGKCPGGNSGIVHVEISRENVAECRPTLR